MPARKLAPNIRAAIVSGHVPTLRAWRRIRDTSKLTHGEKVCRFIERYIIVPEGPLVGEPMRLEPFQEAFILAMFDGPTRARRAILSVGRKAGKTALVAALLLTAMLSDLVCARNSRINSAALSREQAALVFNYMQKSIRLSRVLSEFCKITPSGKRITAISTGIEYHALAAEAGKAMGLSPAVVVGDEWGQVIGPSHDFIDALLTSQGAHEAPLAIIISTQAPSDADWLSIQIDDAERNPRPEIVCHNYAADENCKLMDRAQWRKACPALGKFRSLDDVKMQAEQAARMPTAEAKFRNLILNQRVALERLWLAPSPWKACSGAPDLDAFRAGEVALGLDLSKRTDLTAAVLAVADDSGASHLLPFVFTPTVGLEDRAGRDRAPYEQWVRDGLLIAVPGSTVDYEWVALWLRDRLEDLGIEPRFLCFDRWRWELFKKAADECGALPYAEWIPVGQGFRDMSPRMEAFEAQLLAGRIRHGGHPLLNMAAANAIATQDPAGNRKLDKSKSTTRIDPIVAAVMALYQISEANTGPAFESLAMIG